MIGDMLFFIIFIAAVWLLAMPVGAYMATVWERKPLRVDRWLLPIERGIYRIIGTSEQEEMNWKQYAASLLIFNGAGIGLLFILQLAQQYLPLNPAGMGAISWPMAWNTAVSFVTNTNWQAYAGETTMSYFTQMVGLTVQNFASAATGLAAAAALMRGLTGKKGASLGNFWVDMVRTVLRILLPLAFVFAVLLAASGVPQNFHDYTQVTTLEGMRQIIAQGPAASQEAIKLLGTNGGGFFNANSAHPFENPTPLTNVLEMLAILVLPAGTVAAFGRMSGCRRQAWAVLGAMTLLFVLLLAVCYGAEKAGNPILASMGISGDTAMEGKEMRFGIASSALFTAVTTAASCGAVNAMHASYTGLGSLVPLLQMMVGEVVFGGVGSGFYGMMLYVWIAVFIIGLMVGRTPEYLGKKIDASAISWTIVGLLLPSAAALAFAAVSAALPAGLAGLSSSGPHGFSEIVYAFVSAAGNNGSAFAGLQANTAWYHLTLSAAMLIGRYGVLVSVLAVAGNMAGKQAVPAGKGTFDTGTVLFALVLSGIVLVIGALTFFPALALGPIADQMFLLEGTVW